MTYDNNRDDSQPSKRKRILKPSSEKSSSSDDARGSKPLYSSNPEFKRPYSGSSSNDSRGSYGAPRPYNRDNNTSGRESNFNRSDSYNGSGQNDGPRRNFNRSETDRSQGYNRSQSTPRSYDNRSTENRSTGYNRNEDTNRERFTPRSNSDRPSNFNSNRTEGSTGFRKPYSDDRRPSTGGGYNRPSTGGTGDRNTSRPYEKKSYGSSAGSGVRKPYSRDNQGDSRGGDVRRPYKSNSDDRGERRSFQRSERPQQPEYNVQPSDPNAPIRLNKYLANTGLCSRREADMFIQTGLITVNGNLVTEMGVKVLPTDEVKYNNSALQQERKVYILLNKPKDYVTSLDDPHAKRTVMDLLHGACRERIYPVGRLDRMTTGVLLLTNDGELTKKLTHPTSNIKKIYQVQLDKNVKNEDLLAISEGVVLEDGFIQPDKVGYVYDDDSTIIGVEIHSGRNRIVRRIFEHLGYKIVKLDRVYFGGLTKKSLQRGKWRFLDPKEVGFLRMLQV